MRRIWFAGSLAFLFTVPATLSLSAPTDKAQHHYEDDRLGEHGDESDKFKFARIKTLPMMPGAFLGDRGEWWSHDYPDSGLHFSKILSELSKVQVVLDENEFIFTFDDPNIFKYPFAYLCEPGYMELSDTEIAGMREYLLRGGFLIIDDFRGPYALRNLTDHLKRAFPEFEIKQLDISHPIFNCFFSIKTLDVPPPYGRGRPVFFGIEDNNGRLMAIINYNNDVSEYWQWSNDPSHPFDEGETNGAYKFGVNYAFYALTH